VNERITDS